VTPPLAHSAAPATLRNRLLATTLVPSIVFIGTTLGIGWFLSDDAARVQADSRLVVRNVEVAEQFLIAVLDERRDLALGGDVRAARERADAAAGAVTALAATPVSPGSPGLRRSIDQLALAARDLPQVRQRIVDGSDPHTVYEAFEPVVVPLASALQGSTVGGGDDEVAAAFGAASAILRAGGETSDATLLASASAGQVLEPSTYPEYVEHSSELETFTEAIMPTLDGSVRARSLELIDSTEWARLSREVSRIVAAGPASPPDPSLLGGASSSPARGGQPIIVPADYALAGDTVALALTGIGFDHAREAAALQADRATVRLTTIVAVVLACIAGAILATTVAFRMGTRLTHRLVGLRADTLRGAAKLPDVLDRLRRGEEVDVRAEIPDLDYGRDEIGQMADAITHSRQAAIDAAAEEARTRAGANAVFLNIARRSQAIVHRQLQVLDEAERVEHNSDQLARLFQLDHLTTRERRNAENLIIMGGHEPRRQWRRPVSLSDVLRSAVSETEQYTRVTLGDVPDTMVDGSAVGDLIHLVAELVDNATSFSPPHSPIDVRATAVGRGVVVEVLDRGLGIDPEPRARLNTMLADPPDFSLMTLSDDSRLGLFVVARLAHRHGVRVTLTESPYGGVQVIALIPHSVLADPDALDVPDAFDAPDAGEEAAAGRYTVAPVRVRPVPAPRVPADADPDAGSGLPEVEEAEEAGRTVAGTGRAAAASVPAAPSTPESPSTPGAPARAVAIPAPAPAPDGESPPLPERRPQAHLARELQEAPGDTSAGEEPPVRRSSTAMAGLQRGSRAARSDVEPHRNGDRP
jgi:signal transduction histidine kinase